VQGINLNRELYCKFYLKRSFQKYDPLSKKVYTYNVDEASYYILMVTGSQAIDGIRGTNKFNSTYLYILFRLKPSKVNVSVFFS